VPHDIVIAGRVTQLDMERLRTDLKRVCEAQIALFEPKSKKAPMDRYVFMTLAVSDGYGGLEHRASTALICNRTDLPVKGRPETEGYRTYLGLCSHEYFHTWNVKRIKPAAFVPYDLGRENYTSLLWLFEGFTSYYDDLMLVRSGLMSQDEYFAALGRTIGGVLRGTGRLKQSVADSSFDAWIKYYRQDENATNAIVSYYTKGSLVALAFDLAIRAQTRNRKSLDDVMRLLWQRYGRDFYRGKQAGVGEDEVDALIEKPPASRSAACSPTPCTARATCRSPNQRAVRRDARAGSRERRGREAEHRRAPARRRGSRWWLVYEGGAAHRAAVGRRHADRARRPAHHRHEPRRAARALPAGRQGRDPRVPRDELRTVKLKLDGPDVTRYRLTAAAKPAAARNAREAWLNG
jgi:hypothetical protein